MAQSRHVLIKLISGGLMLASVLIEEPYSPVFIDMSHDSPCAFEVYLVIYF